jgi:Sigma-70, region 4
VIQDVGKVDSVTDVGLLLFRATRAAALKIAEEDPAAVTAPEEEGPAAAPADPPDPVDRANRELPVLQREALALREVEGRSVVEIGELTGVSPDVAARRTWRGLLASTDCERAHGPPVALTGQRHDRRHVAAAVAAAEVLAQPALGIGLERPVLPEGEEWVPAAMLPPSEPPGLAPGHGGAVLPPGHGGTPPGQEGPPGHDRRPREDHPDDAALDADGG